jgi:hypothetical protein
MTSPACSQLQCLSLQSRLLLQGLFSAGWYEIEQTRLENGWKMNHKNQKAAKKIKK